MLVVTLNIMDITSSFFDFLPKELWIEIFDGLSFQDLISLSSVKMFTKTIKETKWSYTVDNLDIDYNQIISDHKVTKYNNVLDPQIAFFKLVYRQSSPEFTKRIKIINNLW